MKRPRSSRTEARRRSASVFTTPARHPQIRRRADGRGLAQPKLPLGLRDVGQSRARPPSAWQGDADELAPSALVEGANPICAGRREICAGDLGKAAGLAGPAGPARMGPRRIRPDGRRDRRRTCPRSLAPPSETAQIVAARNGRRPGAVAVARGRSGPPRPSAAAHPAGRPRPRAGQTPTDDLRRAVRDPRHEPRRLARNRPRKSSSASHAPSRFPRPSCRSLRGRPDSRSTPTSTLSASSWESPF